MTASRRMARVLAPLVAVLLSVPAFAQDEASIDLDTLNRRAAEPLAVMARLTRAQCDEGNQRACRALARLRRAAVGMTLTQQACEAGQLRACTLFDAGLVELLEAYREFEALAGKRGGLPADALGGELFGEDGVFSKVR